MQNAVVSASPTACLTGGRRGRFAIEANFAGLRGPESWRRYLRLVGFSAFGGLLSWFATRFWSSGECIVNSVDCVKD